MKQHGHFQPMQDQTFMQNERATRCNYNVTMNFALQISEKLTLTRHKQQSLERSLVLVLGDDKRETAESDYEYPLNSIRKIAES